MIIEKEQELFSITRLTNYGKNLLLTANEDFSFNYFALVDQETNYNFVNSKTNTIAKGLGTVDTLAEDDYTDVLQQPLFEPLYKTEEIQNYLLGSYNNHNLLPDKIKNEFDVFIDMQGGAIALGTVVPQAQEAKKIEVITSIISGNIGTQSLTIKELDFFAVQIDIEGILNIYDNGTTIIKNESEARFDSIYYEINFQSSITNDEHFTLQVPTTPATPYTFSVQNIKKTVQKGIVNPLFGILTVKKFFTIDGTIYSSLPIQIELDQQQEQFATSGSILTINDVYDIYQLDNERRNFYIATDFESNKLPAKVYTNDINNVLLNQSLNGYLSLKNIITLDCSISYANNIHLYLENIGNKQKYNIFSLIGDSPLFSSQKLFTTLVGLRFQLQLIKQETPQGVFLHVNAILPQSVGLANLSQDPVSILNYDTNNNTVFQYQVLENNIHWVNILVLNTISLGTNDVYQNLSDTEKLFLLTCDEHNLIYNYDRTNTLITTDFQNLIFNVVD